MFDFIDDLLNCRFDASMMAVAQHLHQWIKRHVPLGLVVMKSTSVVRDMASKPTFPKHLRDSCLKLTKVNVAIVSGRLFMHT